VIPMFRVGVAWPRIGLGSRWRRRWFCKIRGYAREGEREREGEGEARCFREERSAEYEVTDYGQVREIVATCGLTGFVWSICSSIRELKLTQPAEVSEDSLARLGSGINQGISQLTGRG
jgi:hypothetical protein